MQKWFFSDRVSKLSWSPLELFWQRLKREKVRINMASGSPDERIAIQRLRLKDHLLEASSEISERDLFGYPGSRTPEELRKEVISLLEALRVRAKGKELVITTGAQHGIDLIGKLIMEKGDKMACENPTFIEGFMALRFYSSGEFFPIDLLPSLDLNALRGLEFKLFYSMPTLHNPLGVDYSEELRKEVAEEAEERGFLILEDDPYRFSHERPPRPISEFSEENVIFLMSFSKMISPGFRCAAMLVPEEYSEEFFRAKQLDFSLSPLSYYTLYLVLREERREILRIGEEYVERIRHALRILDEELSGLAEWTRPKGGFYIFVRVPGVKTRELLERCLRRGLAFVPGEYFYPKDPDPETIRLSISKCSKEEIEEGIGILKDEIKRIKPRRTPSLSPRRARPP